MKRIACAMILICLFASPCFGQVPVKSSFFSRVVEYVKTHKVTLASDTLVVVLFTGDGLSTWHAKHVCPTCSDATFGKHFSELHMYAEDEGSAAAVITISHLARHFAPSDGGYYFVQFGLVDGPLSVAESAAIWDNLHAPHTHLTSTPAMRLESARQRLMQSEVIQ